MIKRYIYILLILLPFKVFALIEVDITRGNLSPLPIAVSSLSIDKESQETLKKILKKKDICMANADEVKSNTGFSIGGVAPIAHIKKLDILIDKSLSRFKHVFGAAGHPNCVFKIEYDHIEKA